MIDGVCGGIAHYFALDPTLVRISWVLLTLLGGAGLILYIAAMILVPPEVRVEQDMNAATRNSSPDSNHKFWGILLIGVGVFWLATAFGFHFWPSLWAFPWDVTFPVLLILAGVAFMFGGRNYIAARPAPQPEEATGSRDAGGETAIPRRRLYRSRLERKILGVCGGIGTYLAIDPVLVRLAFVLAAIASVWFAVLGYGILAIVMTKEPEELTPPAAVSS